MRTTTKRGIGRGAAVTNGNGRAILPPEALSTVARYRQPPPPRRRFGLLRTILGYGFLLIVVVAVGAAGGFYLWAHEGVSAIRAKTPEVRAAQKRLLPPLPGQAAIALLVGYDRRAGIEKDAAPRSDTIMLVRADPETKSVSMLSFPRDLVVDVVCPGRAGSSRDRINQAFSECGVKGTLETVKKLTGLPINYLITVNFRGFKQIVSRVGGVWIDVDRHYFNDNAGLITGVNTYAAIDLKPGYQRLNGGQALDFARYRHTDSDIYRNARQQLFVKAFKEQLNHSLAPGPSLVYTLPRLVGAITSNVEVGVGGGKEIDVKTLLSWGRFFYGLPNGHFFQARIDGLSGYSELSTDASNVTRAVEEFTSPDVEAPEKAVAVALDRKPKKAPALAPRDTTVTVLNGNGVPGSAGNASYLLGQRGYKVVVPASGQPANAPRFDYFRTKVYFDRGHAGAGPAAKKLANLFGGADVGWIPPEIRPLSNGADVVVTVGQTFHGSLAPAPLDRTPQKEPARVTANRGDTESLLREARGKVPFRLLMPTVIEQGSYADRGMPIRTYKIVRGHKAVRLTFKTGGGEFWGIEQTDWTQAPVLAGRSFRHAIAGRTYDLYYSGPHLHMVVLRSGGATYWVVNTLLDTMSNETMLAIAKGLQPLK